MSTNEKESMPDFHTEELNITSDENGNSDLKSAGFDELFGALYKEINSNQNKETKADEFKSMQTSLTRLPKLYSSLEHTLEEKAEQSRNTIRNNEIINKNDPILPVLTRKQKPKNDDSGSNWFHMHRPELTTELKRDISLIKQRNALDPKRHYKKERWETPEYFQVGTIKEGNTEFYSSRLKKSERGKTIAEELLNDDDRKRFFKRKYGEIQAHKTSGGKAYYKKIKNMRKKF